MRLHLAMLYVKDLPRMTAFYAEVLGLPPKSRSETWVAFDGFALHAIPGPIAAGIEIHSPPAVRESVPFKPLFAVADVGAEVERLEALGVTILRRPWGSSDGVDPEGNVFGINEAQPRCQTMAPMIHVPDVRATVEWYKSIGFQVRGTYEDCDEMSWASVTYGGSEVMFNTGGRASDAERREVDLYIRTDGVDILYQSLKDRVEVVVDLYNAFHGMREFIIRDCNRFWITFGQPI